MDIIKVISAGSKLLEQGNALKSSATLANTEALAVLLYSLVSAILTILQDFGVDVSIGTTDLHTMTNGWAITAGFFYGLYRIITNPSAGTPAK